MAWLLSINPAAELLSFADTGIGASGFVPLVVAPSTGAGWMFVAWGLLGLARITPAWPTALVGPVATLVLMVSAGLGVLMLRLRPTADDGMLVVTIAAAVGYALAAAVTARYRGRRDRTEHRGEDG